MTADPLPDLQHDVQRLLGRCLLALQQYESLLKKMLANHELGGQPEELEALRQQRIEDFSGKTLGQLSQALFEQYVVIEGTERSVLDESKLPPDRMSFSFQLFLEMTPERHAQTKAAVKDLVATRNDLVHHLIDRFDLWSTDGCVAAARHLTSCHARIRTHYLELCEWAKAMDQTRAMSASFLQSDVVRDHIVNGIAPDGRVDWRRAGIVQVLREGAQSRGVEGWARLDGVTSWITETHPEQTPAKYGCATWPQVLHDSRQFQLVYRRDEDARKVPWFRALT